MEIQNRKAKHDYEVLETIEAGLVLKGTEIKSLRQGKANLKDSYALLKKGEIFILGMHISPYDHGNNFNHDETRTRKCLLHKKEINKIADKINMDGYTLVPLKIYFVKNRAKVLLGIAKGRKNYDKRELLKKRDMEKEMRKAISYKNR